MIAFYSVDAMLVAVVIIQVIRIRREITECIKSDTEQMI